MPDGGGLINLGELSKPATVLIERVSDAVGGIARPWQTRRVAQAEAEAEIIRAEARIKVSELEQRALVRMIREEGQKQENIESITERAIPHLSESAKPEKIERDWLTYFFDRTRTVSDEEMQSLWSKILAGEANEPGAFSKRTVDLASALDKSDAHLFTRFCQFCWMIGGLTPVIPNLDHDLFKRSGIIFPSLSHLDDIGLVSFSPVGGFQKQNISKYATFFYYAHPVTIEFSGDQNSLPIGSVLMTRAGAELAGICGSSPSKEFFEYVLDHWYKAGYILSMPVRAGSIAW